MEKNQGIAASKAGMEPKTARRYLRLGRLPSELKQERHWRTREDPFGEVWETVERQIQESPGLEAKTMFEWLQRKYPGRFSDGQIRTLQRRVKLWRVTEGHRESEQRWMISLTQGQFGREEVRRTIGDTLNREDIGNLLTCICNEPLKYRNRAVAVLSYHRHIRAGHVASFLGVSCTILYDIRRLTDPNWTQVFRSIRTGTHSRRSRMAEPARTEKMMNAPPRSASGTPAFPWNLD